MYSVRAPGSQTFLTRSHAVGAMLAPSPGIEAAYASDRLHAYDAPRGMIAVNPAGVESKVKWASTRENAVIAIEPDYLEELAASELGTGDVELLPPPFGTVDMQALQMAESIKAELTQHGTANEMYIDSLITIFGIHLLRNYTAPVKSPGKARGGLSAHAARRVQEYLDEHFTRKLSVAELSAVCALSPGHFIQSFTRTFGHPPHRYLVNRRLAFAEKLLCESDMRIAEVAYLSGFSSQSHLTSAMRRYKRVTPAQLRMRR